MPVRFLNIRIILWLLLSGSDLTGLAQISNKEELEQEKGALKKEIEQAIKDLDAIKKNKKVSLTEITLIQKKQALRRKKINTINMQLAKIEDRIKVQAGDIDYLKNNADKLKKDYKQSIVQSYKFYNRYNPSLYILNARHFSQLIDNLNYLKSYRDLRAITLTRVKQTHRVLEIELNRLEASKASQKKILIEQKDEFDILRQEEKERQSAIKKLRQNEKTLSTALKKKQKRWDKIKRLIQQEIKKEIARTKKEALVAAQRDRKQKRGKMPPKPQSKEQKERMGNSLTYAEKDYHLAKTFVASRGSLSWPTEGYITMHFGKNAISEGSHINYNNSGITLHPKVRNQPIKSVFDGVITSMQYIDGGMLITIRHGRYWSIYTPVYNPSVKSGQEVKAGQIIGYTSASDEDFEFEFQLMRETTFLNPEQWLKKM